MNQLAHGPQEAVDRIGQIAGHLLHPPAIGLRVDPGDVHPAGLQLDHEEDEIPPQTGVGARMRAGLRASNRRARHLPMRYETGLPSSVIRFRTLHASTASLTPLPR